MCPACLSKKHSVPSIVSTSKPNLIPLQISGVCVKMTQANLRNPLNAQHTVRNDPEFNNILIKTSLLCVCQSVLTFLAGLCQRDVLLYEPLQHQVSCWMLCHVKLQRAQRAQRIKHKVTIKASFSEYPSKTKSFHIHICCLNVDTFVLVF